MWVVVSLVMGQSDELLGGCAICHHCLGCIRLVEWQVAEVHALGGLMKHPRCELGHHKHCYRCKQQLADHGPKADMLS